MESRNNTAASGRLPATPAGAHSRRSRGPTSRGLARAGAQLCLAAVFLAPLFAAASPAIAQGPAFTVSAAGVVGGAFDTEGGDTLDNVGFQLGFTWDTWEDTRVGVRAARISFSDELVDNVFDPELTYVTIAGEYMFTESYYRSGLYLGLGLYQMEGLVGLETQDDNSLGFALGATGDFEMTPRFSIVIELSGHYVDLELGAQFYGFLTGGIAYHF
jgi:hypothetical protein